MLSSLRWQNGWRRSKMAQLKRWEAGRDYFVQNVNYSILIEMLLDPRVRSHALSITLAEEMVKGNTIVEIGPASNPLRRLFDFQPKKYICVEPTARRTRDVPDFVEYVNEENYPEHCDGVSFLETLANDSVAVVSAGVFDFAILRNKAYAKELARLIYEKTIPGGLSLHYVMNEYYNLFFEAGFDFERGLRRGTKTWEETLALPGFGAAIFYRKPKKP